VTLNNSVAIAASQTKKQTKLKFYLHERYAINKQPYNKMNTNTVNSWTLKQG